MKRIALSLVVAGALVLGAVGSASGAAPVPTNAQGCPGDGNSTQAHDGNRAELVAEAKATARASGENFGSVQSGYNHTACGHGNQS